MVLTNAIKPLLHLVRSLKAILSRIITELSPIGLILNLWDLDLRKGSSGCPSKSTPLTGPRLQLKEIASIGVKDSRTALARPPLCNAGVSIPVDITREVGTVFLNPFLLVRDDLQ